MQNSVGSVFSGLKDVGFLFSALLSKTVCASVSTASEVFFSALVSFVVTSTELSIVLSVFSPKVLHSVSSYLIGGTTGLSFVTKKSATLIEHTKTILAAKAIIFEYFRKGVGCIVSFGTFRAPSIHESGISTFFILSKLNSLIIITPIHFSEFHSSTT